ncbi:MAG: GTP-binding protein [Methanosarcinales archaeon Met12]|nr:MAG: GTP-binding protein [Methanosarcinales archaeon Met12]
MGIEDDIKAIEDEIRRTPYNKATQVHIGRLKAKLARLKEDVQSTRKRRGGGGYSVKKSGDATVILVGFPSVGKSTLLNKLTSAQSQVADYDFTTIGVIPGSLVHRGAHIQLLDVPGLIEGAAAGKGHGKEVLSVIRSADLLLLMTDIFHLEHLNVLKKELFGAGVRINELPPNVTIRRKATGGIIINRTTECEIDEMAMRSILNDFKIHNADVLIRENITIDQFIDIILGTRKYVPALQVLNKLDLISFGDNALEDLPIPNDAILISAEHGSGLDDLKDAIFEKLGFIRIYMKPRGEGVNQAPMILMKGSSVSDVCDRVHRDFKRKFRYAQVWGRSVKHRGQRVGLEHTLRDEDVLTLVMERKVKPPKK